MWNFPPVAESTSENSIKITVTVINNSSQSLQNLTFKDPLEIGFAYQSNSSSPVSYDSDAKEIHLQIEQLSVGETFSFEYFIEISSSKRSEINGKTWLRNVALHGDDNLELTAVDDHCA